jgi:hypothetical protein
LYRERLLKQAQHDSQEPDPPQAKSKRYRYAPLFAGLLILLTAVYFQRYLAIPNSFTENFNATDEHALATHGWMVWNRNAQAWSKRQQNPGLLTLYTLNGDNWPDSTTANPHISNLLVKELPFECFSAELQLVSFVPGAEWQQAGLLLLKDSSANSPSVRISLAYNDYFGGYHRSKEIVTQAIYNSGNSVKPEEFLHSPVLMLDSAAKLPILLQNLHHVSLRIEKQGRYYHFLFAGGVHPNAPFKEVSVKDMAFEPHYIGIFAIKGNATKATVIPVLVSGFTLRKLKCN